MRSGRDPEHHHPHDRTAGRAARPEFAKSLNVHTAAPLDNPERFFAALPGVDSCRVEKPASYVLTVSDAALAAPAVTRALVGAGADVLSIAESHHSLEDVYLQLIDHDEGQVAE